jgi:hypothetical protein
MSEQNELSPDWVAGLEGETADGARDSNPDMNEMGRCWEDYSRSGSSMLRSRFGVTKTTMLHGQKAFPSLFRPICLRVQLSSPHMTRRR